MTKKLHNQQNYKSTFFISSKIKSTDDKKYYLTKTLYKLNDLKYEKGTRKSDYAIREVLKDLQNEVDKYYSTIMLFDSGKNGDMKAYEDILIFFDNHFLDAFSIHDKLQLLKKEIGLVKEDESGKTAEPDATYKREKNEYLSEFEKKITYFEIQFKLNIIPQLKEFLNNVNQILLYEKAMLFIESLILNRPDTSNNLTGEDFKTAVLFFLNMHNKINLVEFSKKDVREFINITLNQMEIKEALTSEIATKKFSLNDFIEKTANTYCTGAEPKPKKRASMTQDEVIEKETAPVDDEALRQLDKLLDELYSISIRGKPSWTRGLGTPEVHGKKKEHVHLFHVPGSFEVSLKTVADYLANSLIFIYYWLKHEIIKQNFPADMPGLFEECITQSIKFVQLFGNALIIASENESQTRTLVNERIRQFIPKKLAHELIDSVKKNCTLLDDALGECSLNITIHTSAKNNVLFKKIKINHDFFTFAKNKILKEIRQI
jgi:hypothetical protein